MRREEIPWHEIDGLAEPFADNECLTLHYFYLHNDVNMPGIAHRLNVTREQVMAAVRRGAEIAAGPSLETTRPTRRVELDLSDIEHIQPLRGRHMTDADINAILRCVERNRGAWGLMSAIANRLQVHTSTPFRVVRLARARKEKEAAA